MAYCPNCGDEIQSETLACPTCGAVFGGSSAWHPLNSPPHDRDLERIRKLRLAKERGAASPTVSEPQYLTPPLVLGLILTYGSSAVVSFFLSLLGVRGDGGPQNVLAMVGIVFIVTLFGLLNVSLRLAKRGSVASAILLGLCPVPVGVTANVLIIIVLEMLGVH